MCERVRHQQCRRLYVPSPVLSGLYRLLGAILRSKTKVMAQFCSQQSEEQGQGKQGAGEGACNKWDICQLLLLLPSMLLPLLLLLSSMLLAAIKTRKNVYFAKAPSFFCLFLAAPSPLLLPLFSACCCSFCLSPFCLLAWTFAPCPSSFMRKSA